MMKRIFCFAALVCLLLSGCGETAAPPAPDPGERTPPAPHAEEPRLSLEELLAEIYAAAPGSAGSSLKAARAAGELLDWVQEDGRADTAAVERWAADTVSRESAGELALFWAAVLTSADALLAGEETELAALSDAGYSLRYESYDPLLLRAAEKELSPLFTQLLSRVETTPYAYEETMPYDAVTLEKLEGLWLDSEIGEMLVISGGTCRVVIPYLENWGEEAFAVRIRDRSAMGYCPALEIDFRGEGDFWAPLTYYVSGVDETHVWSNTQSQRFDRVF